MKTKTTPLKAIREKCLECSAQVKSEVRNCRCPDCPLFHFRLGKNPYISLFRGISEPKQALLHIENGTNGEDLGKGETK